ncbi:RNA-directed DNA polymerase from mobile element jockey [Nymphon striatum]|nr:RNA-directed DNA polymerase from mobile element jockey [Nymphon striatum]
MLLPKDSGKSFISDRTPFHVPASRATGEGRGRPSGGLQCYINPKIDAKLISSDFNHMCILLPFVTLIGIYFSPKTDIDDILIMLATFLNNAPPNTPILLGGDLNVNINSEEFQELNNFLSKGYNLSLISDPTTNSFYNYKKDGTLTSSRIDHVFCSRSVPVVKSAVFITNDCSDHRPDHIVLKFKRNNTSSSFTSSSSHSHIDIASAADFLSDPAFLAIPETQLISRINSIFSSCSIQAPRRKKNSKPWFNAHSYDLRARCKLLSQSTNRQDYIIARKAYHHHLHHAKWIYEKTQESALINSALEKGLPAIYKSAKAKTNGSTIPISRLHSYANKLFSSDSSYNTFMPIPSCDQNNHSLMSPFLLSELTKILKSVKSKAPSATGCLSPHTLKLLHLDIAPLLLRIFNYALSTGYFPECWLETVLFFLHKNGSKSDPSNYRTIAIENPFLKVFMLLINSRMTQYAESESLLPDFQFGFRPNRNCMSAVSILFEMSKARLVNHKRTYCAFMDFSKAFDKIDRNLLFQKLQLLDFLAQARIAHLFYALPITHLSLDIVHAVFRCFILPIFTYGSHIWLSSFSKSSEASVNSVLTKFLKRYLCLPVFSHNALTHLFTRSQPLLFTLRLNTFLNPLKCISRCLIKNIILIQFQKFPHHHNGNHHKLYVYSINADQKHIIPEIGNFMKSHIITRPRDFVVLIMRMLKVKYTDHVTNKKVKERIGAEKIQWAEDLARRKLKFAGHVMRGRCETLTQLVLEGLVEGKRDRGRQRRIWGDDLKEWTRSKNLGEVKRKAENKVEWRIMVHDLRFEDVT